jgi:hypothetical protein
MEEKRRYSDADFYRPHDSSGPFFSLIFSLLIRRIMSLTAFLASKNALITVKVPR